MEKEKKRHIKTMVLTLAFALWSALALAGSALATTTDDAVNQVMDIIPTIISLMIMVMIISVIGTLFSVLSFKKR